MKTEGLHNQITTNHQRAAAAVLAKSVLLLGLGALATLAAQGQTFNVLYSFTGSVGDGAYPSGGVVRDAGGNLYGFTLYDGAGYGTVYKVDTSGNETVLHSFNLTDGSGPQGSPVMDAAGNIYGITGAGGALQSGTVFKLDTSGNLTVLYDVPAQPRAGLARDAAGNLYGTTFIGGDFGNGTVFKLDTSGTVTVLHSFGSSPDDGILPTAPVYVDAAGNIYGTTENGGAFTYGTIFKVDASGNYTVLHSFTNTDGAYPAAGLIADSAGNLYGTAYDGGASNLGVVFKVDTAGNLSVLHSFTGSPDAAKPAGGLVRDAAGNLYGTAVLGGAAGLGAVFKVDPSGNATVLYSPTGTPDANEPYGDLISDAAGTLYGTTYQGGASNVGTVFSLTVPPAEQFNSFTAQVVVSRKLHSTAVTGKFNSTGSIDPSSDAVSLSVAGTNSSNWTFAPGSFANVLGGYTASATSGSTRVTVLLVPLKNGNWSYSAAILGFVPGSASVTVSLAIGGQSGSATVNAQVF